MTSKVALPNRTELIRMVVYTSCAQKGEVVTSDVGSGSQRGDKHLSNEPRSPLCPLQDESASGTIERWEFAALLRIFCVDLPMDAVDEAGGAQTSSERQKSRPRRAVCLFDHMHRHTCDGRGPS